MTFFKINPKPSSTSLAPAPKTVQKRRVPIPAPDLRARPTIEVIRPLLTEDNLNQYQELIGRALDRALHNEQVMLGVAALSDVTPGVPGAPPAQSPESQSHPPIRSKQRGRPKKK